MIAIKIPREDKQLLSADVQKYIENELSENIGNLAAEGILDFVLNLIAPYVYNQAVADVRKVIVEEAERVDEALSSLERPIARR